jgi:CubicO group peptidase (beta-lactamase class C family)
MNLSLSRRTALSALAFAALSRSVPVFAQACPSSSMQALLDYVQGQKTTGFLVIRDRKVLVERDWPSPVADPSFKDFAYETTRDGALLEDVASQQKSFVSMLVAIAVDKGLVDLSKPVSDYVSSGWSKAAPDQEASIRIIDVLTMSSGLNTDFSYAASPGTVFLYNTPVYAIIKRVLAAAAKATLESITRDWLTAPAGMNDTSWRRRPAAFADVGNPTGLVTSPRDTATFGQIVLDRGRSRDGRRIVSETALQAMFDRSATNPAYGHLWWLNGGAYTIRPLNARIDGPLIPGAPADLVAALGALDRKLYIVPSRKLIVVRMGPTALDKDFDQQLWSRLMPALAS